MNWIATWRIEHGLTQEELAVELGVSNKTVSRWESGTRSAPPYLALALHTLHSRLKRRAGARAIAS